MKTYKSVLEELSLKRTKSNYQRAKITGSRTAFEYVSQFYGDDISIYESFFILLLNRANNTIGYVKISQGGIVGTVVDTRMIAKYAIEALATSIIMVHNHPSGAMKPSTADIEVTKKVQNTLKIFDVSVLDHLIIGEDDTSKRVYYSMGDNSDF